MRPTGVWMVSGDQDHAFRGQYVLQLGTKSGYLTVVSRVPGARVLYCAAGLEEENCSIIDHFPFNDSKQSLFRLLNRLILHRAAYSLHNLPKISSRIVMNSGQN